MSYRCCHDEAQFVAGGGRGRGPHGRHDAGRGCGCGRAGSQQGQTGAGPDAATRKDHLEASRQHLEERLAAVNEELSNL
jgi:hypothetical protein